MRHLSSLLAACLLSACAGLTVQTTPQWDSRFGIDTRLTLTQQISDPQAGRNADPVSGMDARSARAAYERYLKAGGEASSYSSLTSGAK